MSLIVVYIRSESGAASPHPSIKDNRHVATPTMSAHLHKKFQFNIRVIFDYAVWKWKIGKQKQKTKANSERKLHFVAAFVFEKLAKQWAERVREWGGGATGADRERALEIHSCSPINL